VDLADEAQQLSQSVARKCRRPLDLELRDKPCHAIEEEVLECQPKALRVVGTNSS
jgi:hypothetical protein